MRTRLRSLLRSRLRHPALFLAVPVLVVLCLAPATPLASLPRIEVNIEPVVVWTAPADAGQATVAQFGFRVAIRVGRFHLDLGWPRLSAPRATPDGPSPQPASARPVSVPGRPLVRGS